VSRLITPLKRLWAPIGIAALLTIASSAPSAAQIYFPAYPPVRYGSPDTSVRLDVKPKDAAVYVDGFYAGVVDDFDGVFQRLHTAPGGHEITLYLDGYRTFSQKMYLPPTRTFTIRQRLEKLPAGEIAERPPAPAVEPAEQPQGAPLPRGPFGRSGLPRQYPPQYPPPPPQDGPPQPPNAAPLPQARSGSGTLELNLQPPDAEVLVDGQPWRGSDQQRLTIDLSEGRHNIQIRKPGYVGYLTDVQIRRGETTPLDVNLRTQPETQR
jgi:hypothetical protein